MISVYQCDSFGIYNIDCNRCVVVDSPRQLMHKIWNHFSWKSISCFGIVDQAKGVLRTKHILPQLNFMVFLLIWTTHSHSARNKMSTYFCILFKLFRTEKCYSDVSYKKKHIIEKWKKNKCEIMNKIAYSHRNRLEINSESESKNEYNKMRCSPFDTFQAYKLCKVQNTVSITSRLYTFAAFVCIERKKEREKDR